jgi:hypothetical protein
MSDQPNLSFQPTPDGAAEFFTLGQTRPMNASKKDDSLIRLRSSVSKLFSMTKYYSAYVQEPPSPGALAALLRDIQSQVGLEDVELTQLIERYLDRGNILSQMEYESLREPLMSACQSLIKRKLANGSA